MKIHDRKTNVTEGMIINNFEPSADNPDSVMGRQPDSSDSSWSPGYSLFFMLSLVFKKKKIARISDIIFV